ncbi:dihydrofolate reductase family protein [Curtobacterium sp. AB7]|uniref:dihydrofolate reductase family protein n=1 Tax=Curtobacterium sp. AB7 TaxID=3349327 RepID=UPI003835C090
MVSWLVVAPTPDSMAWVLDTVAGADLHAFGRKTFETVSAFWPAAPGPIAEPMNRIPKVVFTTQRDFDPRTVAVPDRGSPAAATWTGARVASGLLEAEVAALKQESDAYVLAQGGTEFGRSLVRAGLVDEYRLAVLPVALGSSDGVFAGLPDELDLHLVSSEAFAGGALGLVYRSTAR